jgi:hypothetical protein
LAAKLDYYAGYQPWKLPRWLYALFTLLFGVTAVGAVVMIVKLTYKPQPPKPAVVAEVNKPAAAEAQAAQMVTPANPHPYWKATSIRGSHRLGKHGKGIALSSHKGSKLALGRGSRTAAAARSFDSRSAHILAKRETAQSRKAKADIDRMLGL